MDKFISTSSDNRWAERWLVTNGGVSFGKNVKSQPVDLPKYVNIHTDLSIAKENSKKGEEDCRAARIHAGAAVVTETLYWLTTRSDAEAGYLVALLNAVCLRRAFAESRESERDFHLHPWRKVPIPRYDAKKPMHRRLAELCASAKEVAVDRVKAELDKRPGLDQQGLSKVVRGGAGFRGGARDRAGRRAIASRSGGLTPSTHPSLAVPASLFAAFKGKTDIGAGAGQSHWGGKRRLAAKTDRRT